MKEGYEVRMPYFGNIVTLITKECRDTHVLSIEDARELGHALIICADLHDSLKKEKDVLYKPKVEIARNSNG